MVDKVKTLPPIILRMRAVKIGMSALPVFNILSMPGTGIIKQESLSFEVLLTTASVVLMHCRLEGGGIAEFGEDSRRTSWE